MQLEDYFDFLDFNDIRIKGHRIGIESILYEYIYNEKTPEEMTKRFPSITLEQIYASILYYLHNMEQIDKYMTALMEHEQHMRQQQQSNPSPVLLKLHQMTARRDELKRKLEAAGCDE
ncbi:MAG TPA: DUF433 domain-containing protein [Thermodesulfovibrionia bacterium]|nr:DUF433 domain-containing protein [Thermodesulfovibrionia bacterium]